MKMRFTKKWLMNKIKNEPEDVSVLACNPKYLKKYAVLNRRDHFEVNWENQTMHCTHGSWGGKFVQNSKGGFDIHIKIPHMNDEKDIISYTYVEYTNLESYEECVKEGLIYGIKS